MVICLERGAYLHMAQLMTLPLTVSCFSKIQIGFTFLVPANPGSPGQRAVKWVCVCVCVCVCTIAKFTALTSLHSSLLRAFSKNTQYTIYGWNLQRLQHSRIHCEAEKRNQFLCVHLFRTWQKLVNFFTYIKESITYNAMYLILARVKNFA